MTTIESKKVTVNQSAKKVFDFLSDLNNFEQLLPEDRIADFSSDTDSCSFSIKGMAELELIKTEVKEAEMIRLKSGGKAPFKFHLNLYIEETESDQCESYLKFEGDLNPFLKMMVEKPLSNFFNMLADKLKEIHQ